MLEMAKLQNGPRSKRHSPAPCRVASSHCLQWTVVLLSVPFLLIPEGSPGARLPSRVCSLRVVLGEGAPQKGLEGAAGITPGLDTCRLSSPALPGPEAEEPSREAELALVRLTLQEGAGPPPGHGPWLL